MQEVGTDQIGLARCWLVRDACRQIVNGFLVREPEA